MKVFLFSPLALENGRGGEISLIELASGFHKFYDVTLFDTNRVISESLLSKESIKKKLNGAKRGKQINFATMRLFNRNFSFPYPWEIIKLFKVIKKNDIIYSSVSNLKIDLMLVLFSLLRRQSKFIIGFRKPLYSKKILSLYNIKYRMSILLYSLFKNKFHFHTISEHAKKFLENFYEPQKITHIIHGVNLKDYVKDEIDKKQEDVLNFIYVGFLDDIHKGVGVMLDGIEKFIKENKELKVFFEFCGIGPLESKIRKLQEKFPMFVKYNGYISNEQISEYYKRNDIFLFTSRREPFGRVIIEALASKLIIICTKTYGSMEILKGKKFAFFLRELKSDVIKDKILSLYKLWQEKNNYFKSLQESAKIYALENYAYSKELEMFKELIHKLKFNN